VFCGVFVAWFCWFLCLCFSRLTLRLDSTPLRLEVLSAHYLNTELSNDLLLPWVKSVIYNSHFTHRYILLLHLLSLFIVYYVLLNLWRSYLLSTGKSNARMRESSRVSR
jgi:hypothetical protein